MVPPSSVNRSLKPVQTSLWDEESPIPHTRLGQMGKELLLASEKTLPQRLEETGFHFKHRELKETLKSIV